MIRNFHGLNCFTSSSDTLQGLHSTLLEMPNLPHWFPIWDFWLPDEHYGLHNTLFCKPLLLSTKLSLSTHTHSVCLSPFPHLHTRTFVKQLPVSTCFTQQTGFLSKEWNFCTLTNKLEDKVPGNPESLCQQASSCCIFFIFFAYFCSMFPGFFKFCHWYDHFHLEILTESKWQWQYS